MSKLIDIPLALIRTNPAALRGVNHEDLGFQELVGSIKSQGVLNAIVVRPSTPEDTLKDAKEYILIDGLQRFTASMEAGRKDIPAQVIERDEAESLAVQIMGNAHRIETKPVDYMRAIMRLLAHYPTMTETELAAKLGKSSTWIGKILGLSKLNESLKSLVNESKINLSNAFMLTKLPPEEQMQWATRAQTDSSTEFTPKVNARVKEIRDANRKGENAAPEQFVPVMTLRTKKDIEAEIKTPAIAAALISSSGVVKNAKSKEDAAAAGFALGLAWAVNYDPESIKAQKAKDDERRAKVAADKARREKEKADKKAAEASDNTANAGASTAATTVTPTATAPTATKAEPVLAGAK